MKDAFHPNIVLLENRSLTDMSTKERVITTAKEHVLKTVSVLNIKDPVNITLYPNPKWAIKEVGTGGYAPTGDWAQVYLDLSGAEYPVDEIISKRMPRTIYHELNHIARWRSCGYGTTLEETFVTEGLASVFESEMWPHYVPPWRQRTDTEIESMLDIVRQSIQRKEPYNHAKWFFGKDQSVPKWLGYSVGYYIVSQALKGSTQDIVSMTNVPASEVIALSGCKLS